MHEKPKEVSPKQWSQEQVANLVAMVQKRPQQGLQQQATVLRRCTILEL